MLPTELHWSRKMNEKHTENNSGREEKEQFYKKKVLCF